MTWDVFICHASEDKEAVARPLAVLLERAGARVWLDASTLTLGDSLSQKIDNGLANSHYGVVILSKSFFAKAWPARELSGLVQREIRGRKVILPVWHEIDHEFILQFSPTLADKLAISTSKGLQSVSDAIMQVLREDTDLELLKGRVGAGDREGSRAGPRPRYKAKFTNRITLLVRWEKDHWNLSLHDDASDRTAWTWEEFDTAEKAMEHGLSFANDYILERHRHSSAVVELLLNKFSPLPTSLSWEQHIETT